MMIIMVAGLSRADFNPREDITGKGVYNIYDFLEINGTNIYQNGSAVLNADDLNETIFNYSLYANSSEYWDGLDDPTDFTTAGTYGSSIFNAALVNSSKIESTDYQGITLDDVGNPESDTTLDFASNTMTWNFNNPSGGVLIRYIGNFANHAFELLQDTGNPTGGHLFHVEAEDPDVQSAHFLHTGTDGIALIIDDGVINFTDADGFYTGEINQNGYSVLDSSDESSLNVNSSNYWDSLDTTTDITSLGTIGTGTWQGSVIQNAYIAEDLTISSSGSVDWTANTNYPTACPSDTYVTQIGDTTTCTGISDVYLLNTGDNATGNYIFSGGTFDVDTLNTGQGDNELYAMNQNVQTTDAVTFENILTTNGTNITGTLNVDNYCGYQKYCLYQNYVGTYPTYKFYLNRAHSSLFRSYEGINFEMDEITGNITKPDTARTNVIIHTHAGSGGNTDNTGFYVSGMSITQINETKEYARENATLAVNTNFKRVGINVGTNPPSAELDVVGEVEISSLSGSYSGGSAYVCVYDDGTLYASETACP